jgi:hypothetical protein
VRLSRSPRWDKHSVSAERRRARSSPVELEQSSPPPTARTGRLAVAVGECDELLGAIDPHPDRHNGLLPLVQPHTEVDAIEPRHTESTRDRYRSLNASASSCHCTVSRMMSKRTGQARCRGRSQRRTAAVQMGACRRVSRPATSAGLPSPGAAPHRVLAQISRLPRPINDLP